MEMNETDSIKQVLPSEEVTQMTSPAMDNWSRLLNPSRRQEEVQLSRQTKRSLQKSIAASAKKKIFDSQNPTIILTEGDKKRFNDISIKETFLSKDGFTLEGTCGPIHRVAQLQNTSRTVARNFNLTFFSSQLDHFFSKRTRQGGDAFHTRDSDSAIAEAVQSSLHTLLTKAGPIMFMLQPGVVTVSEFVEQILTNRTQVFLSPKATNIMATQLDGRFTSQDYIRVTERSAEWNMRWLTRLATDRGLSIDSIKAILYPTQLYEDAMDHTRGIHTRIRQTSHSRHTLETQRELQDILKAGQAYLSHRLSTLANFYDSMQSARDNSEGMIQRDRIHELVHEYNRLANLANGMYIGSVEQLRVPPLGRIVPIESPIFQADERRQNEQWLAGSATERPAKKDLLRVFNETVLSTNGIQPGLELAGLETVQFL